MRSGFNVQAVYSSDCLLVKGDLHLVKHTKCNVPRTLFGVIWLRYRTTNNEIISALPHCCFWSGETLLVVGGRAFLANAWSRYKELIGLFLDFPGFEWGC